MDGSCIGLSVIPGRMSQERALAEFQGPPLTNTWRLVGKSSQKSTMGSQCDLQHWKISHSFMMLGSFQQPLDSMGLLNISLPWHVNARRTIDVSSGGEWSKKSVQQGRSIACCVPEGATVVDARSVLSVREHGKMARTPLAAFFNIPSMGIC